MSNPNTPAPAAMPMVNADTLLDAAKRVLPEARVLNQVQTINPLNQERAIAMCVAVPSSHKLEVLDLSKHLPAPERTKASALASDLPTLLAYLARHHDASTTVWVNHNPEHSSLSITGRINDHLRQAPGWADHTVAYTPTTSVEWRRWNKADGVKMDQLTFANFLEDNLGDINPGEESGLPSAGDMLKMAVAFEAVQDMRVKSHARLQDGGIRLEFADAADDTTATKMEAFARFRIVVPVFYGGARFPMIAKLRFNARKATPEFWFDLVRPDLTHQAASLHLIEQLRQGLQGEAFNGAALPVFMGA